MLLFNMIQAGVYSRADVFQNILCCCLTEGNKATAWTPALFQNILCCCLTIENYTDHIYTL